MLFFMQARRVKQTPWHWVLMNYALLRGGYCEEGRGYVFAFRPVPALGMWPDHLPLWMGSTGEALRALCDPKWRQRYRKVDMTAVVTTGEVDKSLDLFASSVG